MARRKTPQGVDPRTSEIQQAFAKRYISADLARAFETTKPRRRRRRRSPEGVELEGVEVATLVGDPPDLSALIPPLFSVILELNVDVPGGPEAGRRRLLDVLGRPSQASGPAATLRNTDVLEETESGIASVVDVGDLVLDRSEKVAEQKSLLTDRYLFARLRQETIERLVRLRIRLKGDGTSSQLHTLIYKAWPDNEIESFVYTSAKTIKADAACVAFSARGEDIVWAVADTGIDAKHPHFTTRDTTKLPEGLYHLDFTGDDIVLDADMPSALKDEAGHGTHVAGIIAGECEAHEGDGNGAAPRKLVIRRQIRQADSSFVTVDDPKQKRITGVAPLCKLMSLKVLNDKNRGQESALLAALGHLLRINDYGRKIRVHGVNLSVGYEFDPRSYATGHSPLCNEVNRLARMGVVVVAAAGNAGYGRVNALSGKQEQAALGSTIADPGNAELAITVGSTHRDMPHQYGVSHFSSKGPTADGRAKPDILAPGERIVSCASNGGASNGSGTNKKTNTSDAYYREESGTSMAAPHVSGAIAAFLSIRREFIGQPEAVKALFLSTATDLKRLPDYQGRGLIDLMRAIQAV